jgi:hypothetical protein
VEVIRAELFRHRGRVVAPAAHRLEMEPGGMKGQVRQVHGLWRAPPTPTRRSGPDRSLPERDEGFGSYAEFCPYPAAGWDRSTVKGLSVPLLEPFVGRGRLHRVDGGDERGQPQTLLRNQPQDTPPCSGFPSTDVAYRIVQPFSSKFRSYRRDRRKWIRNGSFW